PLRYLRTVLRSNPVWRAIAEIVQPRLRRACTSTSSSHVSMRKRASFDGATGVRHQQLRRRPALLGGATRVGNFDERQWGISASAVSRTVGKIIDTLLRADLVIVDESGSPRSTTL